MITMLLREKLSLTLFMLSILSLYGSEVVLFVRYIRARMRNRSQTRIFSTKPAVFLHVLAAIGIVCLLYGYLIEPYRIEVNTMTVRTPKLSRDRFRIVQISDLHCDDKPRNEGRAVQMISEIKPDVIVATGDYLNRFSAKPRLQGMLRRLDAPLGKFAIKGNFEVGRWSDPALLESTGFRWLERDTVIVSKGDDAIRISGLSLDSFQEWRSVLQAVPGDCFHVFLFHTPDLVEDIRGLGVDLYLCGHTHGGQVALPVYGALVTLSKFGKKYESGRYEVEGTMLYVNRGLGMERMPAPQVRFCSRPEIAVFDIVPE
ncbi:MAG: metallophosphoesterase [Sedimentisphaerales bacterium]|nr:metallophosphoesterase [Sedimentisphaerales bacterium]